MSKFLAYESFLVDIGTSVAAWKTQFETSLTDQGWQIFDSTDDWTEFIPPVTQAIGTSTGNGVLRAYFDATSVRFEPRLRFEGDSRGSVWHVRTSATGYASHAFDTSLTIGGVTWTVPNQSPWTGNSRTENLYNEIVADINTYPDGRDAYTYTLRTDLGSDYIIEFTRIDPDTDDQTPLQDASTSLSITRQATSFSANKTVPYLPASDGWTAGDFSVNIDLASGFIYYLSIFERSIVFATKTTVDYYGPIAATWIDNQLALDQTPSSLVPVELYTVDCSNRNSTGYFFDALSSHSIGYYKVPSDVDVTPENYRYMGAATSYYASALKLPFGEMRVSDLGSLSMLIPREHQYFSFDVKAHAGGVSNLYGSLLEPVYPIVNVELFKAHFFSEGSGFAWAAETTSSFLDDVYMYASAATDESLHLARIVDITTGVSADATSSDTSITVGDTSLFPENGTIIVNSEIMEYTGKTATTFTGLTRGMYGTVADAISIGDTVYATNWFVKINDGAILAGTTKPTAQ